MNEKQADAMLAHLKRIESLLEAIDWKVWNFHQKVLGEGNQVEKTSIEEEETEQLAAVIETPRKVSAPSGAAKSSYPSIEKWS